MEIPAVREIMDLVYRGQMKYENEIYDVNDKLMELPYDDYKISCLKVLDTERFIFTEACSYLNAIAAFLVLYVEMVDEEDRFKVQQMIRMYEKRLEACDKSVQYILAPNTKIVNRAKKPYHETMTRRLAEFIEKTRDMLLDDLFYNRSKA